eukprot:GSChrysophyteH1.ASY1.ANO1.833.1 assembled CDS
MTRLSTIVVRHGVDEYLLGPPHALDAKKASPSAKGALVKTRSKLEWGRWGAKHARQAEEDEAVGTRVLPGVTHETHEEAHPLTKRLPKLRGHESGDDSAFRSLQSSIARNHSLHPYTLEDVVVPLSGLSSSSATRFQSLCSKPVQLYFDSHGARKDGTLMAHLTFKQSTSFASFPGHNFYFTYEDGKNVIGSVKVSNGVILYHLKDPNEDIEQVDPEGMKQIHAEQTFLEDYQNRTGIPWRSYFGYLEDGTLGPRAPPVLKIRSVEKAGDAIEVTSSASFWSCDGLTEKCQGSEPLKLKLEAAHVAPKVFVIKDLVSEFEADFIIRSSTSRMSNSVVGSVETGSRKSTVRTSQTAWLARHTSVVTDTIYRRLADVLDIDEARLVESDSAESLQVVHYGVGQKYDSHHDWTFSTFPQQRFCTLLIYLSDQRDEDAGGETSFPKAGFKVRPRKGMGVLFYNMLDDGNGDDLTLHASLPVKHEHKYMANLWVWDDKRGRNSKMGRKNGK